jgi:hypothetical protein
VQRESRRRFLVVATATLALSGASLACNALNGVDEITTGEAKSASRASRYGDGGTNDEDDEAPAKGSGASGGGSGATAPPAAATSTASPDAGAPGAAFFDDFARPNGPLGNGWLERTAGTYALNGGIALQGAERPLPEALAFRPPAEDALDVEISAVVRFAKSVSDLGVFARMQPTAPRQLYGYSFFVWSPEDATIGREDMDATADLQRFAISPPLKVGETVRLVFRVTGTNPVRLSAVLVDASGAVRASATANDSDAARVDKPGSVGFGGATGAGTRYDDFRRALLVSGN